LLDDCRQLREQLAFAEASMSVGFTRGWRPSEAGGNTEGAAAAE